MRDERLVSAYQPTAFEIETSVWLRCLQHPPSIGVQVAVYSETALVDAMPDSGLAGPGIVRSGAYEGFSKGIVADAYGGIHAVGERTIGRAGRSPYWPGQDLGRGARFLRDDSGYYPEVGYEADAFGGIHPIATRSYEPPPRAVVSAYFPGWDVIRGFALLPDNSGGYTVDAWGGLHPFAVEGEEMPPAVKRGPYWPGWDIVRGVTMRPDGGGGYVVDAWGGLHPFAVGDNHLPPRASGPYWIGWDVARGVSSVPGGGGFVVDGWGGTHPYSSVDSRPPVRMKKGPYWPGWDIARGIGMD